MYSPVFFTGTVYNQFPLTSNTQTLKTTPPNTPAVLDPEPNPAELASAHTTSQASRVHCWESHRHIHKTHDGVRHEHSHPASVFTASVYSVHDFEIPLLYDRQQQLADATHVRRHNPEMRQRERDVDRGVHCRRREDDPCTPFALCTAAVAL